MKKFIVLSIILLLVLLCLLGCTPANTPQNGNEKLDGLYNNSEDNIYCIISGNTITVSKRKEANSVSASQVLSYVFDFTKSDDTYVGSNENNSVSFKIDGTKLDLTFINRVYHLSLDKNFKFSNKTAKLNKPKGVDVGESAVSWYYFIDGIDNPYESGILYACFEFTSKANELVKRKYINHIPEPAMIYTCLFKDMDLLPGEYNLSIRYIGGFYVNGNSIEHSLDSDPVTFSLTVSEDNKYTFS